MNSVEIMPRRDGASAPALQSRRCVALNVDLRLVQQIQLVILQGLAQAHFQLDVAHDLHGQRGAVQLGVVLAAVLGVVHGRVVLEQRVAVFAVLRVERDADAGRDEDFVRSSRKGGAWLP
jgi:hypothetical protein